MAEKIDVRKKQGTEGSETSESLPSASEGFGGRHRATDRIPTPASALELERGELKQSPTGS